MGVHIVLNLSTVLWKNDNIRRLFRASYRVFFRNDFNPLVTNGLSHPYHLDESTFILRGVRSIFFSFSFYFSMKIM